MKLIAPHSMQRRMVGLSSSAETTTTGMAGASARNWSSRLTPLLVRKSRSSRQSCMSDRARRACSASPALLDSVTWICPSSAISSSRKPARNRA